MSPTPDQNKPTDALNQCPDYYCACPLPAGSSPGLPLTEDPQLGNSSQTLKAFLRGLASAQRWSLCCTVLYRQVLKTCQAQGVLRSLQWKATDPLLRFSPLPFATDTGRSPPSVGARKRVPPALLTRPSNLLPWWSTDTEALAVGRDKAEAPKPLSRPKRSNHCDTVKQGVMKVWGLCRDPEAWTISSLPTVCCYLFHFLMLFSPPSLPSSLPSLPLCLPPSLPPHRSFFLCHWGSFIFSLPFFPSWLRSLKTTTVHWVCVGPLCQQKGRKMPGFCPDPIMSREKCT